MNLSQVFLRSKTVQREHAVNFTVSKLRKRWGQGWVSCASEQTFHKMTGSFKKWCLLSSSSPTSLNTSLQPFFSAMYCSACGSQRQWKLFTDNNHVDLSGRGFIHCVESWLQSHYWRDFSLVSVQQLTVITVRFWSCWSRKQPHSGSQKLWTDFHLNGSTMHLNNCNREFSTRKLFPYIIGLLCDFICCSSTWDTVSLNRDN